MSNKKTMDLTTGSPIKAIINFGLPIFFGNILQQLYNLTDTAIVGKFLGINALAGVGSTSSLNFLVMGFVIGTCTGFSVPMSQSFGAKDEVKLRKLFINSIYLAIFVSIILTSLTLIFIDDILVMMNTNSDMLSYSKTYISTIFAGIAGMYLYNLMSSALRAVGNSKAPLFFLIASAVANVILDLLFIAVFKWGVFGTAFATVISQTCSGIVCMFYIGKKVDILRIRKDEMKLDFRHMNTLFFMGLPMGLQFSITAIGSVILQSAVNSLGSIYVAAITAGTRINAFAQKGLETIGVAMAMYTGQNIGAGKIDRISKGLKQSLVLGAGYSIVCFFIILFFGKYFALIFVDKTQTDVISGITQFLLINSATYFFSCLLHVFRNTVQGAGYSVLAMFAGVAELLARCFVAFYLVANFQFDGAVFANPVSWMAANMFLIPAYFFVMKRVKAKNSI